MSLIDSLRERIRKGEPVPFPANLILSAATPVTRIGMWARMRRDPARVDTHVISVGNLTAGGTGKTPAVIAHLDRLKPSAENRVGVLTRGYGSGNNNEIVVSSGVVQESRYKILGDEPALILQRHPSAIIFKARDRVRAAECAVKEHGCKTLILDDGFQYVQLHRDVNQLLIDATNPFSNGRLIPRGILREPVEAAARATEIVLTHCDQSDQVDEIETVLREVTGGIPIRRTAHRPTGLVRVWDWREVGLEFLRGSKVAVACGIGNPESLVKTVESLGAVVVQKRFVRDHALIRLSHIPSDRITICTEKDAVKMPDSPMNVFALKIDLVDL